MIDLHLHTTWSDGALIPAELCQRAKAKGLRALAITDHVDHSNLDLVVPALVKFCKKMEPLTDLVVLPGLELTHVPPKAIAELARAARRLGAKWVVVHGETVVEPVPAGTNMAAIQAGVDLLAHPGLILPEEVKLAAKKGVALEVSARQGHSLGNGRVANLARQYGATLILNTDAHEPEDLIDLSFARVVALAAGLSEAEFAQMRKAARRAVDAAIKRRAKP